MKDIEHIRQDLYLVTWVMPQGSDFGVLGVSKIYFFGNSTKFAEQVVHMTWACNSTIFFASAKKSNIIKFQLQSQFQRF